MEVVIRNSMSTKKWLLGLQLEAFFNLKFSAPISGKTKTNLKLHGMLRTPFWEHGFPHLRSVAKFLSCEVWTFLRFSFKILKLNLKKVQTSQLRNLATLLRWGKPCSQKGVRSIPCNFKFVFVFPDIGAENFKLKKASNCNPKSHFLVLMLLRITTSIMTILRFPIYTQPLFHIGGKHIKCQPPHPLGIKKTANLRSDPLTISEAE